MLDPPLALASALHDEVGSDYLLVRADASVDQRLIRARRAGRDDGIRPQGSGQKRGIRHSDVVAFGQEAHVVFERLQDRLLDCQSGHRFGS